MLSEILQAIVFILLAIPFIYMAYDVSRDLTLQTVKIIDKRVRPGITTLINLMIK